MINLTTAIYSKAAGTSFLTAINGRFYKGKAPDNTDYPYVVYKMVTTSPEKTFTEVFENTTIQFSIFSNASGSTEVETIYSYLDALYDECSFTITGGNILVWMRRVSASLDIEEHTTKAGLINVWHYATDFEIMVRE